MKVDRIKIYGCTCSGKTSLAIQLSEILHIPAYHIDDIFWEENWQIREKEEFRREIKDIVIQDRWILDGNYSRVKDLVLPRTTLIIILNPNIFVILWRLVVRSLARRGIIRKEVTKLPKSIISENRKVSAIRSIFELAPHAFKFKLRRFRKIREESIQLVGKDNVFVLRNKNQFKSFLHKLN
jgi:adenylate kinase family enzyme